VDETSNKSAIQSIKKTDRYRNFENILINLLELKTEGTPTDIIKCRKEINKLKISSPNMSEILDIYTSQIFMDVHYPSGTPLRFEPILLVGHPGTGKTYAIKRLSKILNTGSYEIPLSSASEAFFLSGCPNGYGTTYPLALANAMSDSKCINPITILDGIDKACFTTQNRASIMGPLLQALEPESAEYFKDVCLGVNIDLSSVSWIAIANDITDIPEPILSRFHIINVRHPTVSEKAKEISAILSSYLLDIGLKDKLNVRINKQTFEKYKNVTVRE
jgi:ATP-dependent Lon protease